MTNQEIFDLTVQKFIEQGECSYSEQFSCAYHTKRGDKELCCLAGFHVPVETKEGSTIKDVFFNNPTINPVIFNNDNINWWNFLQRAHDSVVNGLADGADPAGLPPPSLIVGCSFMYFVFGSKLFLGTVKTWPVSKSLNLRGTSI